MTRRARIDPTDPDNVAKQQDRAADIRTRELEDFKSVLATTQGRRFFARLLDRAGIFKVSFDNSGSITARNEGMRLVGLTYWADLEQIGGLEIYQQALRELKQVEIS